MVAVLSTNDILCYHGSSLLSTNDILCYHGSSLLSTNDISCYHGSSCLVLMIYCVTMEALTLKADAHYHVRDAMSSG